MPTQQKIEVVSELFEKLERAKGIYFTDYLGLNAADMTKLRREFSSQGVDYRVVKNTLAKLSAQSAGLGGVEGVFEGPTAIAFAYEDPTSPARILKEFRKSHGLPQLKVFILEGQVMDVGSFDKVASLPSKKELLSRLLGGLASPMEELLAMLSGAMSNLVNVLDSLRKTKGRSQH